MRKITNFTFLLVLAAVFTTISCKKNKDTLPTETIDSVKSTLPKQVILTTTINEGAGENDKRLTTYFQCRI